MKGEWTIAIFTRLRRWRVDKKIVLHCFVHYSSLITVLASREMSGSISLWSWSVILASRVCSRSFISFIVADLFSFGTVCRPMDTAGSCRLDNNQYNMVLIQRKLSHLSPRCWWPSRCENEIHLLQRVSEPQWYADISTGFYHADIIVLISYRFAHHSIQSRQKKCA